MIIIWIGNQFTVMRLIPQMVSSTLFIVKSKQFCWTAANSMEVDSSLQTPPIAELFAFQHKKRTFCDVIVTIRILYVKSKSAYYLALRLVIIDP